MPASAMSDAAVCRRWWNVNPSKTASSPAAFLAASTAFTQIRSRNPLLVHCFPVGLGKTSGVPAGRTRSCSRKELRFDRCQADHLRPSILREFGGNLQPAGGEIEQIIREPEPDALPSSDHASQQREARHVLGKPRCELIELLDRERSTFPSGVPDRRNCQNRLVDALAAGAGVLEDALFSSGEDILQ